MPTYSQQASSPNFDIDDLIASLPRIPLMDAPTPLKNVGKFGSDVTVWLKRDDIGCFAAGGNKLRKLEFLVAAAIAQNCDTLLTAGAVQSNHVRLTAAVAAAHGLQCRVLLAPLVDNQNEEYQRGGNVLLSRLLGADCSRLGRNQDVETALDEHRTALRREGRRPFIVPFGGSNWLGSLGYAVCAREIAQQAKGRIDFAAIYTACGSGGTSAGLAVGAEKHLSNSPIVAVCVSKDRTATAARITTLIDDIASRCECSSGLTSRLKVTDCFLGDGYGLPSVEGIAAIRRIASVAGVILDPVYTAKAMAALLHDVERGVYPKGSHVLFLHTGGLPGVFAYSSALTD